MSMDLIDIAMAAAMKKGGGGGGTTDYTDLSNKPQINGNQLVGNKSSAALGITWSGTAEEWEQVKDSLPAGTFWAITDDLDIDLVPTNGSLNPVTSNGVFISLARLDTTTGDIYFGQTRVGRKMSKADYDALTTKDNIYYLTYPTPSQNSGRSLETPPATKTEILEEKELKEPEPELKKGGEE